MRINIIWYALDSKFNIFTRFEKKIEFIFQKNIYFFKKPKFLKYLRNFTIWVAFYSKFGEKKFSISKSGHFARTNS